MISILTDIYVDIVIDIDVDVRRILYPVAGGEPGETQDPKQRLLHLRPAPFMLLY